MLENVLIKTFRLNRLSRFLNRLNKPIKIDKYPNKFPRLVNFYTEYQACVMEKIIIFFANYYNYN
jgi:hypothetical protein